MSQINKVFTQLAATPQAFQLLVGAFEDLLASETEQANALAQRALFFTEDKGRACVSVGRCEMLRELVKKMKTVGGLKSDGTASN